MSTRQSTYTGNSMADFSSALMEAHAFEQGSERANSAPGLSKVFARKYEEYDPYNNRNLNSVITRIRDEGPATSELKDDVYKSANNAASTTGGPEHKSSMACPEDSAPNDHVLRQQDRLSVRNAGDHIKCAESKKNNIWPQLVVILLVSVIAVMGLLLYELKLQSDEMREAMRLNAENEILSDFSQKHTSPVSPQLASLSEEVVGLREELTEIKKDYQASDNKLAVNIPRELKTQLMKITAANNNVSALKNKFDQIQGRVLKIDTEIKEIKSEIVPVKAPVLPNSWVVNLAALSSKEKAEAAFEKLQQSSASPVMQEVVVKGNKMYRISAEGFSTPEEATAFIGEAKEKYGFDGGWIKQLGTHIAGL